MDRILLQAPASTDDSILRRQRVEYIDEDEYDALFERLAQPKPPDGVSCPYGDHSHHHLDGDEPHYAPQLGPYTTLLAAIKRAKMQEESRSADDKKKPDEGEKRTPIVHSNSGAFRRGENWKLRRQQQLERARQLRTEQIEKEMKRMQQEGGKHVHAHRKQGGQPSFSLEQFTKRQMEWQRERDRRLEIERKSVAWLSSVNQNLELDDTEAWMRTAIGIVTPAQQEHSTVAWSDDCYGSVFNQEAFEPHVDDASDDHRVRRRRQKQRYPVRSEDVWRLLEATQQKLAEDSNIAVNSST